MTIVLVDVHHDTHICPADELPHAYMTRQTLVAITITGQCHTPVTIRIGTTTAVIACQRHEPDHRRCGNCRTIVWVRSTVTTFHGYQGPAHRNPLQHLWVAA